MGKFTVGDIVLVKFPFSNLTQIKMRPALVLAIVEFENIILCQITSRSYSSKTALKIEAKDFIDGSLPLISYVRPDKIFTADISIIKNRAGKLNAKMKNKILQQVRKLFSSY